MYIMHMCYAERGKREREGERERGREGAVADVCVHVHVGDVNSWKH